MARLQPGAYEGNVERLNLERELVGLLASGCRAMVAGYTVKREHFNAEFSAGVENISFDALEGFSSPMFLRTVKLKDFPWNGWLQLGVRRAAGERLEPDRRLHRSVRPPHVVCHRRPGRHPLALRGGLDPQPHLRGGGLAEAMIDMPISFFRIACSRSGVEGRNAARVSPPPCGEGLGVGVTITECAMSSVPASPLSILIATFPCVSPHP